MIKGGCCGNAEMVTMIQMWTYMWKYLVTYVGLICGRVPGKACLDCLVKCTRVPKIVQVLRKMFNDCESLERVGKCPQLHLSN